MLLAAKLYIRDAEAEIVRRAAVDLMRAIVRTYDISLLQVNHFHMIFLRTEFSEVIQLLYSLVNFLSHSKILMFYTLEMTCVCICK